MNNKGISFVLVMVMLLVMSSVGLAFVYWLYPEMHQAVKQRDTIAAINCCQSATQWAIAQLKNDGEGDIEGGFDSGDNWYGDFKEYWHDDKQDPALDPPVELEITEPDEKGNPNRIVTVWVTIEEQYSTVTAK